jgi:LuxR family maltose regulon positive regulatory protein
LGKVAVIRSAAANMRGDTTSAIQLGLVALELLPESFLRARGVAVSTLGFAYSKEGDLERVGEAFAELARISDAIGFRTAVLAKCQLAGLLKTQGRLHQAAGLYQEALQVWAEGGGQQLGTSGTVAVGMSDLLREQNDLEAARHYAMDGIEHMPWTEHRRWWENPHDLAFGYVTLARIHQAQGDLDGAADAIQQAEEWKDKYDVYPEICDQIEACRVRLWLATGNLPAAIRWAQESQVRAGDVLHSSREVIDIARARVLIDQGKSDPDSRPLREAVRLLAALAEATEAGGRHGRLIETLVLQALALKAQNHIVPALAILEKCLVLAEPEGYVRVFVDEGAPMVALLQSAASRGIAPYYVRKLLAALSESRQETRNRPARDLQPTMSDLIEPLSGRELEVLQLMTDGLSNREIADELVLAVGTVKAHIHNIYGKLGVRSRTQAIARTRELNLH